MKLSKEKRKKLAEQNRKKQQESANRLAFWDNMQRFLDNENYSCQNDKAFDGMIAYFANVYNVRGLTASLKKHSSLPQLTRDIFREWLSLIDNNVRYQEVLQWLHSARLQEKALKCHIEHEFNQCHPYRIFDYDFILPPEIFSNPDLFTKIIDVTNDEIFEMPELEEYNAIHHPEIRVNEEREWIRHYKHYQ